MNKKVVVAEFISTLSNGVAETLVKNRGELTFYHGSSMEKFAPEEFGNWIELFEK
jgi:hypothetical protein